MYPYNMSGYGNFQTNDAEQLLQQLAQMNWAEIVLPVLLGTLASLALIVLFIVAVGRIYYKAGLPWERMFVPVYSIFWQYRLAGCTWVFWANLIAPVLCIAGAGLVAATGSVRMMQDMIPMFLSLIGIAIFVFHCIYCVKLSKSFGHGAGFGIGLLLLAPIFILILGYGKSEYVGEYK